MVSTVVSHPFKWSGKQVWICQQLSVLIMSHGHRIMDERLGLDHTLKPIQTTKDGELANGYREEEQPVSPIARLFHEPGSNVYIIALVGSKTKIYPGVVKANVLPTILKHPRFSSLQVVDKKNGRMKWVQTEVNIDNHVIVPKLEPNMKSPNKFVEDYISNLTKSSLEMSKPLWELHLLDVKTSDAEGTGIFRVHHSLGDGMSLMSLVLACTRKLSDPHALPTCPVMKDSSYIKFTSFWSVLRMFWNSITALIMFVLTALFLKDSETPIKGPPGVEHKPRRIVRRSVSLDDIKLVKNEMNMTLNDVVLGITQSGLSRYLNRRYYQGKNNEELAGKKSNLPKNIRLRATFFFNLRATTMIDAFVDMMKNSDTSYARWGNKIGYVLLPLNISVQDDPLEYVKQAKAVIDRKKASLEPLFTYLFAKLVLMLFGIKAAGKLNHKVFFNTTLWFSNVPGPQEEITFFGHEIAYIVPSCYGQPNALMIHVVSYVDKVTFTVAVDEDTIPDPERLCDDLEESLRLIKAAAAPAKNVGM